VADVLVHRYEIRVGDERAKVVDVRGQRSLSGIVSPADRGRAYRSPFWVVFNQAMAPARTSIWE
jgi:hypothetical protein